jgi:hypothetical protein
MFIFFTVQRCALKYEPVLRIRIRSSVTSDLDPNPTLMSKTKLNGREILTRYACWLSPGRPTEKENQV